MIISFVAAMSKNRVIGKNNKIPWSMPADVRHMRKMIEGKPLIMGRKTHESIGRPLPDRKNIILTRDKSYKSKGCIVVHTQEEALKAAEGAEEVIIFGGEEIYRMFLPKANRMYLTIIDAEVEGDAFFPEYDKKEWKVVEKKEHKADEENKHDYTFITLQRK
ncbi:type 3 dihydrofolate reductase [Candidatus Woesearchaeota archaeon]|nr:type 3 dihydrofolate reductase [Candidatus Woesearchaeota archaeon]